MGPSKNVAVVGCGHWGKNLVRNFAELGALSIVCDADAEAVQRVQEVSGGATAVPSFEEVLGSGVEGVVIATPAETHYKLAGRALEAGKDVFVEKPLALTYQEGEVLVGLAGKSERILMVGHVLEYHPAVSRLLELVHSGELGQVRYIYSDRLSLGKVRREENILWSFAPHDIAVILRLLGGMPVQVSASGGAYLQPDIADVTVTNLLFDNGVRAHIHVSWLHPFKEQRLVVIGSQKMASFDDISKKLVLYDQRIDMTEDQPVAVRSGGEEVAFSSDEPLKVECRSFLRSIESREPPVTDGQSALRVLKVLEAAQRSLSAEGEQIKLPPAHGGE